MSHDVKSRILFLAVIHLACSSALSATSEVADDHFMSGEDIESSFAWQRGAECSFADGIGIVMRSNWMKRHWIKLAGRQVEFNGDVQMIEEGWFQTFVSEAFTVTLRLNRTGGRGDAVTMAGEIAIEQNGQESIFEVDGVCGA